MPVAPKVASASRSESAARPKRIWRKHQRLLRATEFATVSNAQAPWRASRRLIAMSASVQPCPSPAACDEGLPAPPHVRFGFTVARNHARRAVARNTVKRVLREVARAAGEALHTTAPALRIDIVLRLKAPLPARMAVSWSGVKAQVRREAESLIAQLRRELQTRSTGQTQCLVTGPVGASS